LKIINETLVINTDEILEREYKENLSIKKIRIGKDVKTIGAEAFSMCANLESIEVDENNQWFTSGNGCNAIIDKSGTLLVGCYKTVIPEFATGIGPFAFCGQTKLQTVTIPSHIHRVGAFAFDGCSELVELTIEKGVEQIGEYCFKNCINFETINLPNTEIDIDASIFGVAPFDWDDMENTLNEWMDDEPTTPELKGILNIYFDGTLEEYYNNGDFVAYYLSCSSIEASHVIYVHCKDGELKHDKWGFTKEA
jgi:hypothetical protein